jgi:uncharacterized protein YndB with AHSA1/START domain
MIVFSHSLEIARTPDKVFAFLTDPATLSQWQDVETVTQLTPGPVGPGTRFREIHKALGRSRVEITEVVTYEPGRRFEIRMIEGVPIDARWDFEPAGDQTRLTMTPSWRLPGWLSLAQTPLSLLTVLSFAIFHRRLKRALERSS